MIFSFFEDPKRDHEELFDNSRPKGKLSFPKTSTIEIIPDPVKMFCGLAGGGMIKIRTIICFRLVHYDTARYIAAEQSGTGHSRGILYIIRPNKKRSDRIAALCNGLSGHE